MSGIKDTLLGDTLYSPPSVAFDGETYDAKRDYSRLNAQARRVAEIMADCEWHTLAELSRKTGDPEASISARLRDLRKIGETIEREYVERGLHKYRLRSS